MRAFATVLLSISLAASPMFAAGESATDPSKTDTAVTPSSAVAAVAKPADAPKAETSAIESQLQDLRSLIEAQTQEIDEQRAALKAEQLKMDALEERLHSAQPLEPGTSTAATAPIFSAASSPSPAPVSISSPATPQAGGESPLYFKIGGAEFYPLGFMDLTNVYRTTTVGSGIGTSFNSLPFSNTVLGRISEDRFSAQNSRIGLRTHAKFGDADVTGYLEADFLGFLAPNGFDTSNSDSLRMRLYWVDYRKGMFEMLGGQSWSFLTPNRNGLGALPADLFYSQDVDTNYQLGLTWARQAGVRFILHPTSSWAIGLALENPQQTLPGTVLLPTNINAVGGTNTDYNGQLDTNSSNPSSATNVTNTSVPNVHPDMILKTSFDGMFGADHHWHFDVAGLFRTFSVVNTIGSTTSTTNPPAANTGNLTNVNTVKSTIHGGGIAATENIELVKNLRFIATQFYSDGGGRYIASTAGPDLVVRPNGTLSGVHSGSGIGGFEYQINPKLIIYGYYSGAYFGKNFDLPNATFGTTADSGYGFQAAGSTGNRYFYEATFGAHQMLWRNPAYGDLRLMTQYSYSSRAPWFVNNTSQLATAHNSMVYIDLRYDIP